MTPIFDFDLTQLPDTPNVDAAARIASRNRAIDARFEEGVSRAGWRRLRPGERLEVPMPGRLLVFGVVVWNSEDREVLNLAAEKLSDQHKISVFDLDDVHSPQDLHAFMPFVSMPSQTPIAAEYKDGKLVRQATGSDVRMLIATLAAGDA